MKRNYLLLIFFSLIIATSITWWLVSGKSGSNPNSFSNEIEITGKEFKDEGLLHFIHPQSLDTIKSVHIELADNPEEIMQGLMYRTTLAPDEGMLFIYDDMRERIFWMKNTQISLDIIFVNDNMQIVHIAKHTIPFARDPIPGMKPAQYVLEVNAGFCNLAKIEVGYEIRFIIHSSVSF